MPSGEAMIETGGVQSKDEMMAAPKIFISYRRQDARTEARDLHKSLSAHFGVENVFYDMDALKPGTDWRASIKDGAGTCGILLALIGSEWLTLLQDRSQGNVVESTDDVARAEIELALTNSVDVTVLPVLLDECQMPSADQLPRSMQAFPNLQAARLRFGDWESDVQRLIADLERLAARAGGEASPAGPAPASADPAAAEPPPAVRGPHGDHYDEVVESMTGDGPVVIMLGSGVNTGGGQLPDSDRLAADIAKKFAYEVSSGRLELAQVAQYVDVTKGRKDLFRMLKQELAIDSEPSAVHRFLATFPARLEQLGMTRRHHVIVTTNYDTALERAFDAAKQPYDLAVYTTSNGKFTHLPWDGGSKPVTVDVPNSYTDFPINDDFDATRTLIVKIHGTVNDRQNSNYVITEDNYIDYLSGSAVEQLIPVQILDALRNSHCLFMGYNIRDWNLRVFLKRIWEDDFASNSWAVQGENDAFQRKLWGQWRGVDFVAEALDEYVGSLSATLSASR
jgi:hypothetical protein